MNAIAYKLANLVLSCKEFRIIFPHSKGEFWSYYADPKHTSLYLGNIVCHVDMAHGTAIFAIVKKLIYHNFNDPYRLTHVQVETIPHRSDKSNVPKVYLLDIEEIQCRMLRITIE